MVMFLAQDCAVGRDYRTMENSVYKHSESFNPCELNVLNNILF